MLDSGAGLVPSCKTGSYCRRASRPDALHAPSALFYESIARLFYSSFTDDNKSKARAVGVELDEKGSIPLMWVVYYGFSQVVTEMEKEASGRLRWASAFYQGVSHAWSGVGDWRAQAEDLHACIGHRR